LKESKRCLHTQVHCSILTIAKIWKQLKRKCDICEQWNSVVPKKEGNSATWNKIDELEGHNTK
jgi:hypothetical protein